MEKRVKPLGQHFKPLKLDIIDIEAIVQILKEVSADISLTTSEHILTDLNELLDLKKDCIYEFNIKSYNPYISLNINSNNVWLLRRRKYYDVCGSFYFD